MGLLNDNKGGCEVQARVSVSWMKWTEVKTVTLHCSGQVCYDVWLRLLGIKEEEKDKVEYNRDENDVGCDLKGHEKLRNEKIRRRTRRK